MSQSNELEEAKERMASPERRQVGSFVFQDWIVEPAVPTLFHRMELTEGEHAVLTDIVQYVVERVQHNEAWASAAAQIDLHTLKEKVQRP